jgi:hypothetical protein
MAPVGWATGDGVGFAAAVGCGRKGRAERTSTSSKETTLRI